MSLTHPPSSHTHRAHLELVADSFGDGLLWIDSEGHIVDVSARYADLVGFTREELIGSFPPCPGAIAEERAELVEVAAATLAGHARRIEITLTRRDGTRLPVMVVGSPDPAEAETHALIAIRDNSTSHIAVSALESADLRLRSVIEATDQAVWVGDAHASTEWANAEMAAILGEDVSALIGRRFEDFMPTALRGQARSAFTAARQDRSSRRLHTVLSSANGTDIPVILRLHPFADAAGDHAGVVVTIADASNLAASGAQRQQADPLDMVDAVVMGLDSEGRIRHWNEGAQRVLGYSAAEAIGRSASALLTPGEPPEAEIERRRAIHRYGSWQGELTMQRRDGTTATLYTRSSKVEHEGSVFTSIDVAVDMSDWKDQQNRSDEARSYLGAIANSMADGLYAVTADGRLAFMNPAAERMLGWTTAELKGRVMHSVIHYQRPDGTAFPVHECPAMRPPKAGETVKVEDCAFTRRDGMLLPVSYTASPIKSGSQITGTVVVFTDISERKAEAERMERELLELTWVERLQDALDGERVMLYAQPVVRVATGDVAQYKLSVRVLIDGELVPPDDFMQYVDGHRITTEIDRWVLRRMCKLAAEGASVKYAPSPRTFADPLVRSEFKRVLQETGADPAKICFDITEAAVLSNPDAVTHFAEVMHALGCELGLGDFGTGFGGFPYLTKLPVQYLKVNTEFVRGLASETSNQYVIASAVDLAARFRLATVADGVDSPGTLDVLRELGVDYARGPGLGHFGPAREVVRGPGA